MTIAVTAATGQLGTLVIDALLDRTTPDRLVAIVRDPAKADSLVARGIDVRIAAYDDPAALETALAGVDTVLLISGNEIGQRASQHRNVIDAAVAQGVARLVYTSAPQVDTSTLPVAPEHLETERHLAAVGIEHVLLRNGWYTENYLPALETAAATGSVLTSAGEGRVASAARRDFAEAAAVVLTADGPLKQVYELAGDVAWTHADLAAAFSDVLGRPVEVADVSADEQSAILASAGLDDGLIGFLVATDASIARGELALATGDLSALIGRPTTPIVETFRAAV
jgi:NAD(P)H dehydrogenase (quinone)